MITEFADEYSSLLTADYFNAEITHLQQMIQRRKESDRGDWPKFVAVIVLCTSLA